MIYLVRFHHHKQALFYDFPASLNTDNPIPLEDISGNDILTGCISKSWEETSANLERELVKKASRIKNSNPPFLYVDAMIKRIFDQRGNIRISSFEKTMGVNRQTS